MIKALPGSEGNILVLRAAGKLTDQDYKDVLIPRLELIIREHGKARLLLDMGDEFHGWEAGRQCGMTPALDLRTETILKRWA